MRRRPGGGRKGAGRSALLAAAVATLMLATSALSGCGSARSTTAAGSTSTPQGGPATTIDHPGTTASSGSSATVAGQLPTVPDCGVGAYEPATLMIVCGEASTTATNVRWSSWTSATAVGQGEVTLVEGGKATGAAARLELSGVSGGGGGPQFTLLEVTWTGPSPDGHASDSFRLTPGPG